MAKRRKHGVVGTVLRVALGVVVAVGLVVGGTNLVVLKVGGDRIVVPDEVAAAEPDAQCILVLGASVLADGTPSGILQDRLDRAIELYWAGAAPKILVSGDNGTESYNEVRAMKNYAVAQGVPSEDVFCDHAGFSTYESVYRAKHVFGVERMIVVTQTYHLYRALYCAQALGIDAVGVASDLHEYAGQPWFDAREVLARTKDVFQSAAQVPSTFVGDPISLAGSGDEVE